MCECGCVANDLHYSFPGPGKSFYVLTLSRGCVECDAPSGITIEHIKPGMFLFDKVHREEFIDGPLKFGKWPDSEGVAVITGLLRHEFVKAITPHLTENQVTEDGVLDDIAAEVLLEEAYEDSVVKPHFVREEAPV